MSQLIELLEDSNDKVYVDIDLLCRHIRDIAKSGLNAYNIEYKEELRKRMGLDNDSAWEKDIPK
jgi:hypothetical protein